MSKRLQGRLWGFATAAITIGILSGTSTAQTRPSDPATAALLKRVAELERSLAEVKAELANRVEASATQGAGDTGSFAAAEAAAKAPDTIPAATEAGLPYEGGGHTLGPLQFRGYGDFGFGRPVFEKMGEGPLANSTHSFTLGD